MMTLTRVYLPKEFATYQIFISVLSICTIFATARYELAIVLPKYKDEAVEVLLLSIFLSMIFSIVFQLALLIISFVINYEGIWNYLPCAIFCVSVYIAFYNWYLREKCCILISFVVVAFPIVNLVAAFLLKNVFSFSEGLVYALIFSRFVEVCIFFFYFIKKYGKCFPKNIAYYNLKKAAIRYRNFPKYMIVGGSLDNCSASCPVFLLDYFFGKEITGYYSITMQALSAPSALLAKSVADVFRQQASVLYSKYCMCKDFYDSNLKLLSKISLLVFLGIIFFAPSAYVFVFGDSWRFSGELARYVLPGVCLSLIASPLSGMYIVAMQQKKYLTIQISFLCANLFGFLFGMIICDDVRLVLFTLSILTASVSVMSIYGGRKVAIGINGRSKVS